MTHNMAMIIDKWWRKKKYHTMCEFHYQFVFYFIILLFFTYFFSSGLWCGIKLNYWVAVQQQKVHETLSRAFFALKWQQLYENISHLYNN